MDKNNKPEASVKVRAAWIAFGILTAVYVVSWVARLVGGASAMEVSSVVPWSGMMAFFFFLASVGSGLLMVGAASSMGFLPQAAPWRRKLYVGAVACLCAAGTVVLIDLGRPERVLNMLIYLRLASPFAWDFIFLALSVVLGVVCVLREPGKVLSCAAGAAGAGVVIVEGIIFMACAGRGLWHSASIPLLFLVEAMVAGFALVALLAEHDRSRLVRTLAVLSGLLLVLNAVEWAYGYMPATDAAQDVALLTSGSLAVLYWIQIIGCVAVPFVALVAAGSNKTVVKVASVLLLCGVVLSKFSVLLAGQSLDVLGNVYAYAPSLLEVGISLGSLGLAGLLFMLGAKFFPSYGKDAFAQAEA